MKQLGITTITKNLLSGVLLRRSVVNQNIEVRGEDDDQDDNEREAQTDIPLDNMNPAVYVSISRTCHSVSRGGIPGAILLRLQ